MNQSEASKNVFVKSATFGVKDLLLPLVRVAFPHTHSFHCRSYSYMGSICLKLDVSKHIPNHYKTNRYDISRKLCFIFPIGFRIEKILILNIE